MHQKEVYYRSCPYYVAAEKDVVAFTNFGTLYVLSPRGKLLYNWEMLEKSTRSKPEFVTIKISIGAASAVVLAAAPVEKNVLLASLALF